MSSSSLLRLFLVGLTALTVCLTSASAFAGEDEAKEFYSQAKDAYQAGDFAKASDLLERAYAEDPNLIYQYNRILALQGMEEYKEALRVLDIYENPMKEDGRFDDVAEIRAQLEEAVAEQEKEEAAKAEAETETAETSGNADAVTGEDVQLGETQKRDRIIGWSLVGAGAAAAIVGSPFYTANPDKLTDDELGTYRTVSIITISSAIILSGAGAYFLYRGYWEDSSTGDSAGVGQGLHVTPYVTAEGGGGSLLLKF